jgi:alkylation response protein AidB-like acyl-CoA dehydrogenase
MSATPMPKDGSARDIVAIADELGQKFAANAERADEKDEFVADNYAALKTSGLVEAGVPRELGGGGATVPELAEMLRHMAHHCSSTALAFAMHTHNVATPAWRWTHQKVAAVEPLLKRVAAERLVIVTSGGSDWIAGSGKAEKVDGGYKITGRKVFSSGSPAGDIMTTSAVLQTETEGAKVIHFAVPMSSPHVKIDPVWRTLGMRGTGSHDVVIDGHVVPDAAIALTRTAGEWHPLFQVVACVALPLIYAVYLGVGESACAIATDLARKRRTDNHVTQLVGRMHTELRGAQFIYDGMIKLVSRNTVNPETVNEMLMARQLIARHLLATVELALEAAGGAGFYRVRGLERRFRDIQGARYHPIQSGPQAQYAGCMALGLPIDKVF